MESIQEEGWGRELQIILSMGELLTHRKDILLSSSRVKWNIPKTSLEDQNCSIPERIEPECFICQRC